MPGPISKNKVPNTDTLSKEERQAKRAENKAVREQKRIEKDEAVLKPQAGRYNVDLDAFPKGPMTENRKNQITKNVKKLASKEMAEDLDAFAKAYGKPSFEEPPQIDKDEMLKSARKERRAKFGDALYTFGEGLQGRTADPEKLMGTRLERERDKRFSQYKGATERNRLHNAAWESKYREDALAYIDKQLAQENLDKEQALKYQAMRDKLAAEKDMFDAKMGLEGDRIQLGRDELEAKRKGEGTFKKWPPSKYGSSKKEKESVYSDMRSQIDPSLITQIAKASGGHEMTDDGVLAKPLDKAQYDRYADNILSQMYEVTTDANGKETLVPKPGKETLLADVTTLINEQNDLNREIEKLEAEKISEMKGGFLWLQDDPEGGKTSSATLRKRYEDKIAKAQDDLIKSQRKLKNTIGGIETEEAIPPSPTPPTPEDPEYDPKNPANLNL